MNFRFLFWVLLPLFLFFTACSTNSGQFDTFVYGKVKKTISVDGEVREYYLHIPRGYQGNNALPVVFALHDKGSNGNDFYNTSGWSTICESNTVLGVFPTALTYCQQNNVTTSLWNSGEINDNQLCNGTQQKDDAVFILALIERLNIDFNINKKRLYLAGFGNGGQMVSHLALSSGNTWAAAVQYAGFINKNKNWQVQRNVPVLFQVGNKNPLFFGTGDGLALSSLENAIRDTGSSLFAVTDVFSKAYGLPGTFDNEGDMITEKKAVFKNTSGQKEFEISLIQGVSHSYPSGNVTFKAATYHWDWLKSYTL